MCNEPEKIIQTSTVYMKTVLRSISVMLILLVSFSLQAQSTTPAVNDEPNNCFTKWKNKFEERGAEDIKDGTYEDIIICFRNGTSAECLIGKADVKGGKVIAMYLRREDGTYDQVKKKLKFDVPMVITNGISAALLTMDDQLINVIFPKSLKPKKAGYVKAPEPSDD
jgi:hypothetical protein